MNELELKKLQVEINKLMAETQKINTEVRFYPLVITSGLTLAVVAIAKVFL